jgi:poly(3-hydroxybutyrate) depolymerase
LASLPEGLPPAELPAAHGKAPAKGKRASLAVGAMPFKIAEYSNDAWIYVPRSCQEGIAPGILMELHGPNGFDWQELLAVWKPICDRFDLILIAPKANDTAQWMPHELGLIDRLLADVMEKYSADPTRVVLFGQDSGGAMAFAAASHNRDAIRGVAAVDAMPMNPLGENEPLNRLAIYSANAKKSRIAASIDAAIAAMRAVKIPVTVKPLGEIPRAMNSEELMELARWIDMLDQI